jgi:flagellar motor component MotA
MSSYTTILVHKETRKKLASLKEYARESYDEVINKLITIFEKIKSEGELSDETKRDIEIARKQIKEGKGMSTRELIEKLGL